MVEHPPTVGPNPVLALAFNELLETPQPVTVGLLAQSLGTTVSALEQQLATLAERGWIRRDPAGAIVGSRGLSIEPTRHTLELPHGRHYTWPAPGRPRVTSRGKC